MLSSTNSAVLTFDSPINVPSACFNYLLFKGKLKSDTVPFESSPAPPNTIGMGDFCLFLRKLGIRSHPPGCKRGPGLSLCHHFSLCVF